MRFFDVSIKMRIIGAFALVCGVFLFASGIILWRNQQIVRSSQQVESDIYPQLEHFQALQFDILHLQDELGDTALTGGKDQGTEGLALVEKYYQDARKRIAASRAAHVAEGKKAMVKTLDGLSAQLEAYYPAGVAMARAYLDTGSAAGNAEMVKVDQMADTLLGGIEKLVKDHQAEFRQQINHIACESRSASRNIVVSSVLALLLAVILIVFFGRSILVPLGKLEDFVKGLKDGILTSQCQLQQNDAIGKLSLTLTDYSHHNALSMHRIQAVSSTMTRSAASLNALSETMGTSAKNVSEKSRSVASAGQQMDANMQSIAAASEEASVNVNMVAAAAEEMSATVEAIAAKADDAIGITEEAVDESSKVEESVRELGQAAQEISKVTETINEIADQTNLLALNATIEAARAGEAGKGFAVVANEIKELAKQTTDATQEIKHRIDGVQHSSEQTITVINNINTTISKTNEIVLSMATAVQEQAGASKEIAENVAQASTGIQEVNENLAQISIANGEIIQDIAQIDADSDQVEINCLDVREQAQELGSNETLLRRILSGYTVRPEPFDIGMVKDAHFQWKMKLTAAMAGFTRLESETVPDHHHCAFGKWYDSASEELRRHPAFSQIAGHHKAVHALVKEVLDAVNSGQQDVAQRKLAQFEEERAALFDALEDLYAG